MDWEERTAFEVQSWVSLRQGSNIFGSASSGYMYDDNSDSANDGVKWPNALVALDGVPQLDSKSTVRAMACPQTLHSCALIRDCFRLFVPIVTISTILAFGFFGFQFGVLQLDRPWTDISLQQMGSETVACQRPALKRPLVFLFFSSDPENITVQSRASWIPNFFASIVNLPTSELAEERVCLRVGASFEESSQLIEARSPRSSEIEKRNLHDSQWKAMSIDGPKFGVCRIQVTDSLWLSSRIGLAVGVGIDEADSTGDTHKVDDFLKSISLLVFLAELDNQRDLKLSGVCEG